MALYQCTVNVGARGKGAAHAAYIAREGKYSGRSRYEDLEASGAGNMPTWAAHNPLRFWSAADDHERSNGAVYREIEVSLPRELSLDQCQALLVDFIGQELGDRHAFQWAIHNKTALDGGEHRHAHLMYSERTRDGVERDPTQYFRRYNAKAPAKGGCRKDSAGTEERLAATRARWAELVNAHLARAGSLARVDHRSYRDQCRDRIPEPKLRPQDASDPKKVAALLQFRAAEGARERAQHERDRLILDVSGDLTAALAEAEKRRQAAAGRRRSPPALRLVDLAQLDPADRHEFDGLVEQVRRRDAARGDQPLPLDQVLAAFQQFRAAQGRPLVFGPPVAPLVAPPAPQLEHASQLAPADRVEFDDLQTQHLRSYLLTGAAPMSEVEALRQFAEQRAAGGRPLAISSPPAPPVVLPGGSHRSGRRSPK